MRTFEHLLSEEDIQAEKMEEHNNDNLLRLLSDESSYSSLSEDSYEYYQTDIFDQLPSIQASRPEQNRLGGLESEEKLDHGHLSRGPRDKTFTQPLRNLALCIQAKRDARFGVGVKSYFVFLRYLVYLNLLHCALICGLILGPTTFYGRSNNSEPLQFGGNDSVLDFFLGSGYLDRSPVFFGFYTRASLNLPCLNTPLLYLAGIITVFLLSLIMVVRRTTVGYKHTWMLGKRFRTNMSYKVFCGWDFTIQDPAAAALNHSFLKNDLRMVLDEQRFSMYKAERTLGQRVRLYLLRFTLNMLVLSLLGGAFYLIYFTIETAQSAGQNNHNWLVSLFIQYLPPITITLVNLVLPLIFRKISCFEDFSFTNQVNSTLVRSIFLKLASLGIYLFFVFTTTHQQCRENQFGREMYKLCIFNFLATFCTAFLLNYPRKLVQEKFPSSLLARLSGKQHFLIPFNVLDLVHSQTVSWMGVYYCPLLPLIGTVTLTATFYIKKFTVLRCCVVEQKMFRGSSSSVLFHLMLLLGLLMAATALVINLYQQQVPLDETMIFLSSSCGPFGNGETLFNVTGVCVDSLPGLAQTIVRFLGSEAFALPLILTEIIILTSYVSRGRANRKAIERLKDLLVVSSSDKRFLVKQHATMLRRKSIPTESVLEASGRTPPSTTVQNPSQID